MPIGWHSLACWRSDSGMGTTLPKQLAGFLFVFNHLRPNSVRSGNGVVIAFDELLEKERDA
jgi:hypothetical protein